MVNRILIVGSGAVGFYYGGRLLEAELIQQTESDLDIHFLLRRDYQLVSKNGIKIRSPDGDATISADKLIGKLHNDIESLKRVCLDGKYFDVIMVAIKSTALIKDSNEIKLLLEQIIQPSTRILLLMNGLGIEEIFVDWFGPENIFGGMLFVCVNRGPNPPVQENDALEINHISAGSLLIGHYLDNILYLEEMKQLWKHTKIFTKINTCDSLLTARWSKLAWNIPFTGLSVALGGISTDIIANDPHLRILADKIMSDTITIANLDITFHYQNTLSKNTGVMKTLKLLDEQSIKSFCWGLTDSMGAYKTSTVIDLINNNELEIEFIFNIPFQRAQTLLSYQQNNNNVNYNFPYLESIVRQVNGINSIAVFRRANNLTPWTPTLINTDRYNK